MTPRPASDLASILTDDQIIDTYTSPHRRGWRAVVTQPSALLPAPPDGGFEVVVQEQVRIETRTFNAADDLTDTHTRHAWVTRTQQGGFTSVEAAQAALTGTLDAAVRA